MFRYRLRTLLILLAIGPPMLAWWAWPAWLAYRDRDAMRRLMLAAPQIITNADADGVRLPLEIEKP